MAMLLLGSVPVSGQQGRWEQAIATGDRALSEGDYELAESSFRAALQQAGVFGPEDSRKAESLVRLSRLYLSQGDYAKPEDLYQQALQAARLAFGSEHAEYASFLNEVGRYYHTRRKYDRAEEYYKQAFALRVKLLGKEHAAVAESINNLAILYENAGLNGKAEVYYQYALEIREKALGVDHLETIETMEHYARLLHKSQRVADAHKMEERAQAVRAARVAKAGSAAGNVEIEEIFEATSRVQPPELVHKIDPEYTEEARIARHEGAVVLQADITPEGHACNFRLVRSLGLGLDEKAVEAVMQWEFQPARSGKRKVAYRAMLEINFRLL